MAGTLEDLLKEFLAPPVIADTKTKPALSTDASAMLTDPNSTIDERMSAMQQGLDSGAVPVTSATLAQLEKLQTQSNEFDDTWSKSKSSIDSALSDVEFLLKDSAYKGLSGEYQFLADSMLGNVSKGIRGVASGGKSLDAESTLSSLGSKAFLVNYEKLKGAGAISDAEGSAARTAYSKIFAVDGKIKGGMSEDGMKEALGELKSTLAKASKRLDAGMRWDEETQSAIPAKKWLEKYRNQPEASGQLPTEAEAAVQAEQPQYPALSTPEEIRALNEGDLFTWQGQVLKKGPGNKLYRVKK